MVVWAEKWDLESIFPGGSESQAFLKFVEKLEEDMTEVTKTVQGIGNTLEDLTVWIGFLRDIQNLMLRTKQASSFTYCLTAQDVTDQKAKTLHGRSKQYEANLQILLFNFAEKISEIHSDQWQDIVSNSEIRSIRFPLEEMRQQVIERLPSSQEELINDFAVEGYHSWMSLYTTLIRRMRIPFESEGKSELYTVEKSERIFSSSNRQEREQAFLNYSEAFKENEEVYSSILNNLAGFRLKMFNHRGWNSVLKESLGLNRMSQQTLEAMWEAVAGSREKFSHYFKRKAELMGIDKMSWFDLKTSISETSSVLSFTDGVNFILERFREFSPRMAEFAAKAFEERWVETENRPLKSSMGFHTGFPLNKQSRIFKTYYGTAQNIATLAHELGHGYHQFLISEMPPLAQKYGLNLAETASILSELLVMNGFIEMETSKSEQITLLDSKITLNTEYFFNVYTCYLFEEKFYEERKVGPIGPLRLNELMIEAQKAAYGDVFEAYHPYYWASKFHLYITKSSFFNFPYTFGFLFSSGIYAKALANGERFDVTFENLLRESASMTVEELAAKHLGVDLREAEFWENAVELVISDIDKFLELTEKD
jgi:oligoendopeptidase F